MRSLFFGFIFVFTLALSPALADTHEAVGVVHHIVGEPQLEKASTVEADEDAEDVKVIKTPIKTETLIYIGDTVATGANDVVHIKFKDDSEVTVSGAGGRFTVHAYQFDADTPSKNKAEYSAFKSHIKYIGGQISRLGKGADKPNTTIKLDFGTVGVRGTTFYRHMKSKECWIYLEDGDIDVFNTGGSVNLNPGQITRMSSNAAAPVAPQQAISTQKKWLTIFPVAKPKEKEKAE